MSFPKSGGRLLRTSANHSREVVLVLARALAAPLVLQQPIKAFALAGQTSARPCVRNSGKKPRFWPISAATGVPMNGPGHRAFSDKL